MAGIDVWSRIGSKPLTVRPSGRGQTTLHILLQVPTLKLTQSSLRMVSSLPSVFGLRTLQVNPGTEVTLEGFLASGDGGGGSFIAIAQQSGGANLWPDHGLLFPTMNSNVLLERQGVTMRTATFSELAPHAFLAGTSEGNRLTVVAQEETQAAWWGAVPLVQVPQAVVTVADLYKAVTGATSVSADAVFAVYPFLKEGVFLRRTERSDWGDPGVYNAPIPKYHDDPALPECPAPTPDPKRGSGIPNPLPMAAHVAALQSAIERSLIPSASGRTDVAAGVYTLNRRLAVRRPITMALPDSQSSEQAHFVMQRAEQPQNSTIVIIPSWAAFAGAGTTTANGGFADEHAYGETVPAVRFVDVGRHDLSPSLNSVVLPIAPPPEFTVGRELFLRRGRSDYDSVEPFATGWFTITSVEEIVVAGLNEACRVTFAEQFEALPLVMRMEVATVTTEVVPENETPTGDNYENGALRVTLTDETIKALKTHNPQLFSVPIWRTELVWTNPNGSKVVTRLLHRKSRLPDETVVADSSYPIGSRVLRLYQVSDPLISLGVGATAEWSRESWAFLPVTEPRASRIVGRLQAHSSPSITPQPRSLAGMLQAFTVRELYLGDLSAETPFGIVPFDWFDRVAILTSTEDLVLDRTTLFTPAPRATPARTWAVDLQLSQGSIVNETRVVGGRGGAVQFEEAHGERVGVGANLALDATLSQIGESHEVLGALISTTYTSRDCQVGRVRVAPALTEPAQPDLGDAFLRTRHTLISVAGTPSTANPAVDLDVRALDLGVDMRLVRPYYLNPVLFGDTGAGALVYTPQKAGVVPWASVRLEEVEDETVPLPMGGTDPVVVVVPGVARRLEASAGALSDGAAVLYHRQGGSALVAGGLTPELSDDADRALQVYTGQGWRPYGLLVAVPGAGGWASGQELQWSGELLRSDEPAETPAPSAVLATVNVSVPVPIVESGSEPGQTDRVVTLLSGLQREGFLAGLRFRLVAGSTDARITGGKATVRVRARYFVGTEDPSDPRVLNEGFGARDVVAGPDVVAGEGQTAVDLAGKSVAVAPMRGDLLYWPPKDRIEGKTISDRQLFVRLITEPVTLPDGTVIPFSLSHEGAPTLEVTALIST